ncbi:50S ribosomal protein L6 [Candidatus Collierbacteria bacterium RIFOXYB1_FULL_49_13]|uniref:Large ribosomal subunit protein uL6 n=1 Tax=Candidatus Collierbacteria bacterium RIFOXYB1_FULL_49_13 TaxID=1817728 RepID=A0A1F5FHV4_9BACT|nr:ribosomal protein L6 [uncultured bacterium]OGD79124.1 MAG: 50S ribosomal protein L6 [Candidatus Collierbacteria bacterium RIFOXYB1_FULL_49_13]
MSLIGKQPVILPPNVTLSQQGQRFTVVGPLGQLTEEFSPRIKVTVDGNIVTFDRRSNMPSDRALHGLSRALFQNQVIGVTAGFKKNLELVGTGYRVTKTSTGISLTVGFSHPVEITAPAGISFEIEGNNKVAVAGIDKHLVGQVAANIRKVHPPEPYKGKGVRYEGEVVRKKAGKTAKAGA